MTEKSERLSACPPKDSYKIFTVVRRTSGPSVSFFINLHTADFR